MVPTNRKNISLYQDAKAGLSSLVQQTAFIFLFFGVMLLLTGGNPSSFALTLTFSSGIAFVAWSEQKRLIKLRSQNESHSILDIDRLSWIYELASLEQERLVGELKQRFAKEQAQQRMRDAEERERLAKECLELRAKWRQERLAKEYSELRAKQQERLAEKCLELLAELVKEPEQLAKEQAQQQIRDNKEQERLAKEQAQQ